MRMYERGVISFPKCGRTWIRLFLEYYSQLTGMRTKTTVLFRHDDSLEFAKRILLVRHPCDVMVSYHIHKVARRGWGVSISDFVRDEHVGIPAFNRRYTKWSERKDDQLVVCYEDMFGAEVWVDMLEFFNIPFHREAFNKATEKTRFDNIRKNLGEIKEFPSAWRYLAAERGRYDLVEPENPEAHKFRRGKVGGYVDYLDEDDTNYILENFTLGGEHLEPYRQRYLNA